MNIRQFACFVVANDESANKKSLEDSLVPWSDLEAVSGMEFFPQLATPEVKQAADALTVRQFAVNTHKLLTDSSNAKRIPRSYSDLQHLCQNGRCRR